MTSLMIPNADPRIHLALSAAQAGIWEWTIGSDRANWSPECFSLFGLNPIDGVPLVRDWLDGCLLPEDRGRPSAAKKKVLDKKAAVAKTDFRVRLPSGETRWMMMSGNLVADSGGPGRFIGIVADITERQRQLEQLELLMHETNHRARNLLGLVLAVAHQTALGPPDGFIDRFEGRVRALSACQDLIVSGANPHVEIAALARAQLAHFSDHLGHRITLSGARLFTSPTVARTLGLALHELATNAAKYGALSDDMGRIDLSWGLASDSIEPLFVMSWEESEGPTVSPPMRHGFGSSVIESMVRFDLNGDVTCAFLPAGIRWRLSCPARHFAGFGSETCG